MVKKKIYIILAISGLLITSLFFYMFLQISSLRNQTPQGVSESEVNELSTENAFQQEVQDLDNRLKEQNDKIVSLEKNQDNDELTFRKMRQAIFSYVAKDNDVSKLKDDLLNILKDF